MPCTYIHLECYRVILLIGVAINYSFWLAYQQLKIAEIYNSLFQWCKDICICTGLFKRNRYHLIHCYLMHSLWMMLLNSCSTMYVKLLKELLQQNDNLYNISFNLIMVGPQLSKSPLSEVFIIQTLHIHKTRIKIMPILYVGSVALVMKCIIEINLCMSCSLCTTFCSLCCCTGPYPTCKGCCVLTNNNDFNLSHVQLHMYVRTCKLTS